jgi:hypothetical protein
MAYFRKLCSANFDICGLLLGWINERMNERDSLCKCTVFCCDLIRQSHWHWHGNTILDQLILPLAQLLVSSRWYKDYFDIPKSLIRL